MGFSSGRKKSSRDFYIDRDRNHLHLLADVNFRPVFIIGLPRSGTSILHSLLAATGSFNYVNSYHVIRYAQVLDTFLNNRQEEEINKLQLEFETDGISNRQVDLLSVSATSPEEYCFIIDNFLSTFYLKPNTIKTFTEICRKIQYTSQDRSQQLLLKSPFDFLRFFYIKELFPDAKFIFIHRNPIHITNSLIKVCRELASANTNPYGLMISRSYTRIHDSRVLQSLLSFLFSNRFNLGLRTILRFLTRSQRYYIKHYELLEDNDHIAIKYEDLCDQTGATLDQVFSFLNIHPKKTLNHEQLICPRSVNLLPEIEYNVHRIKSSLRPLFDSWHYS